MILLTAILGLGVTAWALNDNKAIDSTVNLHDADEASQTEVFWDYNGSRPLNSTDHILPEKYSYAANQNLGCDQSTAFCQIKAPVLAGSSPAQPDLSAPSTIPGQNIQDRIEDAQLNGPNETVTMKN
ncbi:hypothetical protein [Sphingobacterium paucimobilis]|nr:hypothetical protein [Sphingobacterium paucimobilis]